MQWIGKPLKPIGRHIRTTLVAGFIVVLPIVVTGIILVVLFNLFDDLLGRFFDKSAIASPPGMGLAALILLIYLAGLITTHVLGRRLIGLGHAVVDMIPVVSSVYRTARQATQVLSAVNNPNERFAGVVLVDFPGYGLKSIGLITSRIKDQDGTPLLAVYMPTSPFPTSGFLVILREEQVTPTDISVDDAMKAVVSAGIMIPRNIAATPNTFKSAPYPPGFTIPPGSGTGQDQPADKRASNH